MDYFNIENKLALTENGKQITFAHIRSHDDPKEHKLHLNDHLEIYVYISGETHYIVEDNYYTLKKGDVLIIPPHSIHVPMLKKPCDYERFYLLFPTDIFRSFTYDPLSELIAKTKENGFKLSLFENEKEEALSYLLKISGALRHESDKKDLLSAYAMILSFLCSLISHNAPASSPSEKTASIPPLLKDILFFIGKSPESISSPCEIADSFHVSLPYLSTLFKKHVGVTIGEYLRTKKIAAAKRLLEDGNSVTFACYESGFSDSSYFIKIFKRCVGLTPNKYKNLYSKK